MKNINSLVLQKAWVTFKIRETLIVLVVTILLPILVHILPTPGQVPWGARLLPIFYAPFIAIVFFRPHVAIVSALFAPTLNLLITGRPELEMAILLTVELLIFTLYSHWIYRKKERSWVIAPLSYLLAKVSSALLSSLMPNYFIHPQSAGYFFSSLKNAIPGIVILTLINVAANKLKAKLNNI